MKPGRIKLALVAVATLMLAAFAVLSINPSQTYAYDGGAGAGSGDSGGGGGWGAITRWNYVNTWQQLVDSTYMLSNMRNHEPSLPNKEAAADYFVESSSGGRGLLNMCKGPNLVRIYYLGASGGIPIKPNTATGTFRWTNPAGGDPVDQYAGSLNGRGVYVICVIDPVESRTHTEYDYRDRTGQNEVSFTSDYAWSTAVTAELNTAAGVDPIGVNNLHDQDAVTVQSDFGRQYDDVTGGNGNYNSKVTAIQNAISADNSKEHATVTLDAQNRAGLAEGGVLSVSEMTRRATITLSQSWSETRSRSVTCNYNRGSSTPLPGTCSYGDWSSWTEDAGSRSHSVQKQMETQPNTGFFQLLSVHCNPTELNALTTRLTALGGTYEIVSQATNVTGQTTTVLRTQHYDDRSQALNLRRILGADSSSLSAEVRRTGQLGFYDKECDAQCISNPIGSGASSTNGATSNVGITTNSIANEALLGGAELVKGSDRANANYFEIFRNNDSNRINVNVWYPNPANQELKYGSTFPNQAGSGNVTIPAAAPVSTTVTRWAEGTPGTVTTDAGGLFGINAVRGSTTTPLFTSNTGNPSTQTNFGTNTYQSPNSATLAGFYRTFDVRSTWASEKDRPQILNIKWEYRPTVWTRFPSSLGFTAHNNSAQLVATTPVTVDQAIDVRCYAQFGTNDRNLGLGSRVAASTGSGTTNNLDRGLVETPSGDNSWVTPSNLVIKFVRGVSE